MKLKKILIPFLLFLFLAGCNTNHTDEKLKKISVHFPQSSLFFRSYEFSKQLGLLHFPDSVGFRLWFPFSNYKPDYLLSIERKRGNWQTAIYEIYNRNISDKIDSVSLNYWNPKDTNAPKLMSYLDSIKFFSWDSQNIQQTEGCFNRIYDGEVFIFESFYKNSYQYSIFPCPCLCKEIRHSEDVVESLLSGENSK
jgi:hypothetical protein